MVAMRWEQFLPWFSRRWTPGDHGCCIGPTKSGKTTFVVGVLPLRKWVMALDPKGGDSTLARLAGAGFQRVESWPPPKAIMRSIEEGEPARLIIGPVVRQRSDLPKLRKALSDALDAAFDMGGWTVYVDELQVAADARMMGLGAQIERNYIAARDKGVSMVTSFQAPRWVPRAAADQSSWMAVWYTRDIDVVNRIAEMTGRPKPEIRGAVRELKRPALLLFSMDPTEPIVATRAPRA